MNNHLPTTAIALKVTIVGSRNDEQIAKELQRLATTLGVYVSGDLRGVPMRALPGRDFADVLDAYRRDVALYDACRTDIKCTFGEQITTGAYNIISPLPPIEPDKDGA